MKKLARQFLFVLVIIASVILVSCGAGTTETGNPTQNSGGDNVNPTDSFTCDFCYETAEVDPATCEDCDTAGDSGTASDDAYSESGEVLFGLCNRIETCFDVGALDCIEEIYQDQNILDKFGADFQTYSDFELLQNAIDDGLVTVNSSALDACAAQLESLSCSDIAYNESTGSYALLYASVPSICRNSF